MKRENRVQDIAIAYQFGELSPGWVGNGALIHIIDKNKNGICGRVRRTPYDYKNRYYPVGWDRWNVIPHVLSHNCPTARCSCAINNKCPKCVDLLEEALK